MKQIFLPLLVLIVVSVTIGCNEKVDPKTSPEITTKSAPRIDEALLAEGFALVENNCFNCHSPDASLEARVAPPMVAVKKHYLEPGTSREVFVSELTDFVKNPSEENSKMPGAIRRFGLMPKMDFDEAQLFAIANYIYETKLEAPDWFAEHYELERKKHGKNHAAHGGEGGYMKRGKAYALATKAVLGKNLLNAIQTKGTPGAVTFCNTQAYPLTDSMAIAQGVTIKRVSDKPRNPNNTANAQELAYIQAAKAQLATDGTVQPKMQRSGEKMVGYYPIVTNPMCLQCHGKADKDILPATASTLSELYPDDQATGYASEELRGIWVVTMDR